MKKIVSLALAAVLALGMSATAFAAVDSGASINGMVGSLSLGYSASPGNDSVDLGTVDPNSSAVIYIYLTQEMFSWDNNSGTADGTVLTSSQISSGKLTTRVSTSAGSKAIDSVTLDKRNGRIEIEFAEELVSTSELDFEFTVYLNIDGSRQSDYSMTFYGTFENDVIDVYGDEDYVDLSYGVVAEAQEYNSGVEMDLGNGVSIHTKLFKGKSYYGTATRESDEADDAVLKQYPDIDNVVTLKTVGLNSTGDVVKLDTDYSDYYVYDKDMNYLGQSNQMLPYSTKYYLANRQLDVTDADDDTEEVDAPEESTSNPETGGDGSAASNANTNPGTGV